MAAEAPVVSTVMAEVPWPLLMVPAETAQLYVGVTLRSPPLTLAEKVIGLPASTSSIGALTPTVGHDCAFADMDDIEKQAQSKRHAIKNLFIEKLISLLCMRAEGWKKVA
jgi:hypothetical protein